MFLSNCQCGSQRKFSTLELGQVTTALLPNPKSQSSDTFPFHFHLDSLSISLMSFADSGRWAIEVAEDYPRATVIGLDLSPMQPEDVPENCEFIIGDLTECLADFDDGSFDL